MYVLYTTYYSYFIQSVNKLHFLKYMYLSPFCMYVFSQLGPGVKGKKIVSDILT